MLANSTPSIPQKLIKVRRRTMSHANWLPAVRDEEVTQPKVGAFDRAAGYRSRVATAVAPRRIATGSSSQRTTAMGTN